jgi:hydroxypyruvate reductase
LSIAAEMSFRSRLEDLLGTVIAAARAPSLNMSLPVLPNGQLLVLGAGKAAALMASNVERHYAALSNLSRVENFVVVLYGHGDDTEKINVIEAGHPSPDAQSLRVGNSMLEAVTRLGSDDRLLMLVSGGASSLLVVPRPGLSLSEKRMATNELLGSGLPISLVNGVRKRLSAIKGGRLALAAAPAPVTTLIISDVPGDNPAEVGSGPTVPDSRSTEEVLQAIDEAGVDLSASLRAMLDAPDAETPFPGDRRLPLLDTRVIMTARDCLDAAEQKARGWGWRVLNLGDAIQGEARDVAAHHAKLARKVQGELVAGQMPVLILSGGETTVTVRGAGRGGRNTEYLLALGLALEGRTFEAIAADTDGIDGMGANAGAYVDDTGLLRARTLGIDLERELNNNNSLNVFDKLQTLITTGPTRTNVNDFRAILLAR